MKTKRPTPLVSQASHHFIKYFFSPTSIGSALLLLGSLVAAGQEARLVKDFNQVGRGSEPRYLAAANGRIFFSADDGVHGHELWVSDGTSEGTRIIMDIRPGGTGSYPARLVEANGLVFFMAEDGISGVPPNGTGLWQSDGTSEGTTMTMASYGEMVGMDDFLFFGASASAVRGLWRIDGNEDGSIPLQLSPGNIHGMVRHQNMLYYWETGTYPPELWKSDGTHEGTVKVAAVYQADTRWLFSAGESVFFKVIHQYNTLEELWGSDGTEEGTVKLREFSLGGGESVVLGFLDVAGTLFFGVADRDRTELWKSDGTEQGTEMVRNLQPERWTSMSSLAAVGDQLYFVLNNRQLWRSDGTDEGTVMVKEYASWRALYPGEIFLTDVEGTLFFTARDDESGRELWKSDGTEAGTIRIKDISAGATSSEPGWLAALGGEVFFRADDKIHGSELWGSDGTPTGTRMVRNINPGILDLGSEPSLHHLNEQLVVIVNDGVSHGWPWLTDGTGDGTVALPLPARAERIAQAGTNLFFSVRVAHGTELWKTDGTIEGTGLVKLVTPAQSTVLLDSWADLNGTLLFTADDGVHGVELWRSDGTESGTTMIRDFRPGSDGSSPQHFTVMGNHVVFLADVNGWQWWRTDGTDEGTTPIDSDHSGGWSFVKALVPFGDKLVFVADGGDGHGSEPWIIDAAGVRLLKNINDESSSSPLRFLVVGDLLFFVARDGIHGSELWKTDSSTTGTMLVRDIRPGSGNSIPDPWANLKGKLVFTADDGVHGRELWRSDGTSAGTEMIRDMTPGSTGSIFGGHTLLGDLLYFGANGELWSTDGTTNGTQKIADGWKSAPTDFRNIDGTLFFVADDEENGLELWASDGTGEGTVQATAIAGAANARPQQLVKIGSNLFFSAYRPDVGRELFVLPLGDAPDFSHPPENRFAISGEPLTLSADVNGDYLRYSWYRNDVLIQDASGPTLTIEAPTPDVSGIYRVVARNLAGLVEATIRVTVDPVRPVIKATEHTAGGFRLKFSVMEAMPFRIEVSEDVRNWTTILEDFAPLGEPEREFFEPAPEGSRRFYRVQLLP